MSDDVPRPEDLHAAARGVLRQIQRLSTAWRFDLRPTASEVDAVSATVAALHRQVAELAAADGAVGGAADRAELDGARDRLLEAATLASRLLATVRPAERGRDDRAG